MVQQKKKIIEDHQFKADQALSVFNIINSFPGNGPITFTFNGISLSIPSALKSKACTLIQKICEYHMGEKQKLLSGSGGPSDCPELPDWFVHYFSFCAEMKLKPERPIVPEYDNTGFGLYTFDQKKNGAVFLSFEKTVTYKGYVGKYWQACHSGSFLLLKTSAKW